LLGWSGMVLGCKNVSKMALNDNLMTTKNSCSEEKMYFIVQLYKRPLLVIFEENWIFLSESLTAPLVGVKSEIERMVTFPH